MVHKGLTTREALARLTEHGRNELSHKYKPSTWKLFIAQFKSPLIFILVIAAGLSILLGHYNDAAFILLVVFINTFLGFFQEYKAENTLEALKDRVAKDVKVIRNSTKVIIDAEELVPGDLLILEPGLKIPGDGDIIEATELSVDESLLTGESRPIHKVTKTVSKVEDIEAYQIFKGSAVVEGIGVAEIISTGDLTKFGQIAKNLSQEFSPVTPIKRELIRISKLITVFVVIISIAIVALGLIRGLPFDEIFLTSVALGVSTIPEGLIIALTITLALGMNRIMSKKAIVKNLPAAETLGDIDVLCVDKTGTLTHGNMQVTDSDFTDKEIAIRALTLCNNDANYIDRALSEYIKFSTEKEYFPKTIQERKHLFPFSSLQKYTGSFDGKILYAVGAPEIILGFSKDDKKNWKKEVKEKAKLGNRMVAVAYREMDKKETSRDDFKNMTFLGLVFVKDPVRQNVADALTKIHGAGVEIKVITGDLKETAVSVLHTLNFEVEEDEILSGAELANLKNGQKFLNTINKTLLFYRTTPDQKLRIVKALQQQNQRVGMMGDGVNDSPAIKKAEIGISVNSATDVSKEVSDLILLDSNFETIVDSIEEGRNIFQNLRKIMAYLFADSLSETVLITLSLAFNMPLPLLPLQLLWINIIEDGLPSLALSFDKPEKNLLKEKPRAHNQSIFDKKVISAILIISLVIDTVYFIMFKLLLDRGYELATAQTMVFAGVALSSLLFLFSAKTLDSNIWKENIFNNKFVNLSVIFGLGLLLLTIYWQPLQSILNTRALTSLELGLITLVAFVDMIVVEVIKLFVHRFHQRKDK